MRQQALKEKNGELPKRKAHAYFEEGRLIVLELMGKLVSVYRKYSPGVQKVAEHESKKTT